MPHRRTTCLPATRFLLSLFWFFLLASGPACFGQKSLFANPTIIPTGNWPAAVYTADINGDGIPDLIYIDHGATATASTTHVLVGDGKGGFSQSAQIVTAGNSLAIGNLMGDGRVDIGWATADPLLTQPSSLELTLHIAPNVGGGGFGTVQTVGVYALANPTTLGYVTAAPVFATGPTGFVVEDVIRGNAFVLQVAGGRLVQNTTLTLPDGAGPVSIADLNGDGFPDVVINGQTGSGGQSGYAADIFLNKHPNFGSFAGPDLRFPAFNSPGIVHSLVLRDVNNDGRPDLIAEGPNGHIDVFPGNGDGTFQTTSIGGTDTLDGLTGNGGHLIALADLNHDGQLDALTSTPIGISALLGQGTAYLGLKGIFNAGPGMHTFATADFDGDGNLDLATDSPEGITILYGNSDGSFQTSRAFAAGAPAQSAALGLFVPAAGKLGQLDAVVAINSRQAQLLLNLGDGTFQFFSLPATPNVPQPTTSLTGTDGLYGSIVAGDFNSDGLTDLAVTADGPAFPPGSSLPFVGLTLQYGRGDGTFAVAPGIATNTNPGSQPYIGRSVEAPGVGPGGVTGLLNLDAGHLWSVGNPPFTPYPAATLIAPVSSQHPHNLLATGPLRKAGLNDLIAQDGGSLKLYLNSGVDFPSTPLGDLAVDGSLTTPGQRTAPDIASTFPGPSKTFGFNAAIGSMRIANVDRDGHADLLVLYDNLDADHTAPTPASPNYLYVWFGDGTGHFPVSAAHPVNPVRLTLSRNYYLMDVVDLNNDGNPDLVLSDGYLVNIQYGDGTGSFGPEQHLLAGQGINSISDGNLRSLSLQGQGQDRFDLIFSNGGTILANPVANKDVLTPNPDVDTGGITVLLNQPQTTLASTAGTLTASPEPSPFESAVTLTATFTNSPAPTGSVTFLVNGLTAGTAPLSNGTASLTLAAPYPAYLAGKPLLPGQYPLSATYPGDTNYAAATLTGGSHTVLLGPTSVVLTPTTPLQTYFGQPIDGTFAVSVVDSNYPTTGTYTLFDNAQPVAICTNLPLNRNGTSVSCPYGNPIFLDAGPHSFTVTYNGGSANGDTINASSSSAPILYTVLPDITAAGVLTSSLNPAILGQNVTFTATFSSNVAVPTGQVVFFDGVTRIGVATLNPAGQASFSTSSLALGTHPITASYAATTDFSAAVSAPLNQIVLAVPVPPAAPFTLTVSPDPVTLGVGRTAVLLVTVTGPLGATLTCTDTFTESACLFPQPQIPVGGASTTFQVSTAAPHDCGTTQPYFLGQNSEGPGKSGALFAATLFACVLLARKRRIRSLLLLAIAALALGSLSGCGRCTDLGTRPGTYSFTVTATASDGSTRQVTVPIRVTIPGE